MRRSAVLVVVLAQSLGFGLTSAALGVSDDAVRCQVAIGKAGRAFAAARLDAAIVCNNALAAGQTCDGARHDRMIGVAAQTLERRIVAGCRDVVLDELGFPGVCPDGMGGSFLVEDLTSCIEVTHATATHDALAIAYPALQAFVRDDRSCQRRLGRAGSSFIAKNLRTRGRCLDARLRGAIPETVDCRAEVAPSGPGTGDARTDDALTEASVRLFERLASVCVGADLAHLGFPGACPDQIGILGLDDVQRCIRSTHTSAAIAMLAAEYPPPTTSTPTPAPTATPTLVSLQIFPASATRSIGTGQNYTVAGTFSNGASRNLTQRVDYASSDESVAVAPNLDGNRGRVLAVGAGSALITATDPASGITSNAATLTVIACAHPICTVGAALASDCDPCVTTICATDASCCADAWDQICVDAVESVCAASCAE